MVKDTSVPSGNSYNQNANGIALINGPIEFDEHRW